MFTRLKRHPRRKVAAGTVVAIVAALAVAGAALAYYGGSGSGTASANAGSAPRTVSVSGAAIDVLYPGQTTDVDVDIVLSGPGNVRVGAVDVTAIHTSNEPDCDPAWFSFTPPPASEFPAGANVSSAVPLQVTGSLTFLESNTLQDACSDASVTLDLSASPS